MKDRLARYAISAGGISVIFAILLIFFYLLQVVVPMFESAQVDEVAHYTVPGTDVGNAETLIMGLEERGSMAVRFTDQGEVIFFETVTGNVILSELLALPAKITSASQNLDRVALGLSNGSVLVLRYAFELSYPDNVRTLSPLLEYPLGESPLVLDESSLPLTHITLQLGSEGAGLAGVTSDNRLVFARFAQEESFITEEVTTELQARYEQPLTRQSGTAASIALTPDLKHLYVSTERGVLNDYLISSEGFTGSPAGYELTHKISSLELLLGGTSLLLGLENGEVQQWMPVKDKKARLNGKVLTFIRTFYGPDHGPEPSSESGSERQVNVIASEQRRKGFAVSDMAGNVTLYYATSHRTLAQLNTANTAITQLAWSARAEHLLALDNEQRLHVYQVRNEYPEISWEVLWEKVWYEGYDEPDYIWQSSASTNEFEPKLSLIPLSFGTIKAAFYAMIFAVPIAIMGAIFTAQFMSPRMRTTVKPSIEIMEALPTVILGFLAGLWLAPFVETHLAGVFTLLIALPAGFIFCAWVWGHVPGRSKFEGWEAALLIPVVLFLIWLSMKLSLPIEQLLFGGDMRAYMSNEWGISYDQRNSLVVGLIMGFAIIPTIFSIAEDALFSVPQHLVRGSLALGATRWQTMMNVVLPAASPAIFSAIMMGFGRAVGETMIVLMATGNTPLMDMSIFQGMRTLAANIAVEVPEAEVASTHYRVLFLAALILFLFTFFFNTIAEVIRHRLRKRYSGL